MFLLAKEFFPFKDCVLNLNLVDVDIESVKLKLEGLKLELEDCFYPNLNNIQIFVDCPEAFRDVDLYIICGAKPR